MFKNLNLAPIAILLGASNAASWNSTDELFCYSDCQYTANGSPSGSSYYGYWPLTPAYSYSDSYCSSSSPCSSGWGDCDSDSDCYGNLLCGQRNNFESLPGLTGLGKIKPFGYSTTQDPNGDDDYCYDPNFQVYTTQYADSGTWDEYDRSDMNTTIQKDESYISRLKVCQSTTSNTDLSISTLLEWDMKSICNATEEASNLYVGDYIGYFSTECQEVTLADGECFNDITTFYTKYSSSSSYNTYQDVVAFGYKTTLGKSGVLNLKGNLPNEANSWNAHDYYYDSIRSPMGSARKGAGNDTDTQICLTSIGIFEAADTTYQGYTVGGGVYNVDLYYNTEIPNYNSSTCDTQRTPINLDGLVAAAAGILMTFLILGCCCCSCVALAVWFFFCRRKSAGSRNEDNQRPSTPEKPAETVQTTTIIQQPAMMAPVMQQPMMMQQPAPMMMQQQQPMMMQQQQPMMMQQQQPVMMAQQPMYQ